MRSTGKHNPVTPDEISRMKELRDQGLSTHQIARMVNRSQGVVSIYTATKRRKKKAKKEDSDFFTYGENWINLFI